MTFRKHDIVQHEDGEWYKIVAVNGAWLTCSPRVGDRRQRFYLLADFIVARAWVPA